jgi:hypothetical protein
VATNFRHLRRRCFGCRARYQPPALRALDGPVLQWRGRFFERDSASVLRHAQHAGVILEDLTDYVRNIEEVLIPELQAHLEPLEFGQLQTGKRYLGGPWTDAT